MAELLKMPKMSDTMTEGTIAVWHKKVGDKIKAGDILAEVETDKATMELESYFDGTLLYIGIEASQSVPVDGLIAIIGESGEDYKSLLNNSSTNGTTAKVEDTKPAENTTVDTPQIDTSNINAEVLKMPKMSDTMTEGTIVAWHKKVGDTVKSGDLLAEVATDKATMELESYFDGTLLYVGLKEGEAVPVDAVIAIIGEKGADFETLLKATQQSTTSVAKESPKEAVETKAQTVAQQEQPKKTVSNTNNSGRIFISPLAKKIAQEKGVNIQEVAGTGENGRITKKDIENFKPAASTSNNASSSSVAIGVESFEEIPVTQMRKTIAKRLGESLFTAPHFYLTMEINMDNAIKARTSINEVAPVKVSFNDMVIKATAAAIRKHPLVNTSWLGDKIRQNHHINIGVAMAVEEGLLVPVVRFADNKSLSQIASEVKDYAGKAKSKKLTPADYSGNTFTISNLGMFGIEEFTAIINSPDACILAVGGIKETVIVKNGIMTPGNVMKVTLSCDHRVVDGAIGAAFLQTLKSYLEDPVRILA